MLNQSDSEAAAQADQSVRRRFVFLLIGLQILLSVVVATGVFQYLRMQRDNALNERLNHAVRTVQGTEEHLTHTLYLVGLTLANLEDLSGFRPGQSAREIQLRLEQLQRQMPVLRSLSLTDRRGRIIASSVAANLGHQLDLDTLLPQVPVERTGLLRLGAVWEGRDFADGRPTLPSHPADPRSAVFFPLALSLPGDSGLVAVAAVNTDFFLNRLGASFDPTMLQVAAYDYNGGLLLANQDNLIPGSQVITPLLLARIKQDEISQQRDTQMDGGNALLAYRSSRNFPLFIVGQASHEQVLAQWRGEALTTFAYVGFALLSTLLMTGLLTARLLATIAQESRLREAQRLAARVFENSNDGIVITDAETRILSVNPAFERTSGYSAAEAVGQKTQLLSSGLQTAEFYAQLWQKLNETGEWRGEIINRREDGSLLTQWLTINRMCDADGKITGYLGFFLDLSELRRSEQLVRRLSTAMEQSPSSILITNLKGEIEYVNPQFERVTGYRADEAIGRNPRFMGSELTAKETFRKMWNRLLAGEQWEGEIINKRKDGTVYYDYAKLAPMRDTSGRITHFLGIQNDISARKAMEETLRRAKDAAESASRAKSAFLANMSHELRTPMNGVLGMIEIAKRRMSDGKGLEQLDKAKLSAQRLLGVLNDILDISKIEAEHMVLEEQALRLIEIIDNVNVTLGAKAAEKGLNLVFDIPDDLARRPLLGDALRLGQILINLVSNAIKFTECGDIVVRTRQVSAPQQRLQLHFEVTDNGIGINADAQSRLFMPFEQADNSMTRKYGGTGLGLAISKRLVQMMDGDIGVESSPGQGSRFWFNVWLDKSGEEAFASESASTNDMPELRLKSKFSGARILLAEDEPINQEVSRGLLEDVGLVVDLAEDGRQALSLAQQNRYALILMDLQMPHLNGIEATRAIRAQSLNCQTPILAMTANAFDEDRQMCIVAGMNDYIAKPVAPENLYKTLLAWLEEQGRWHIEE